MSTGAIVRQIFFWRHSNSCGKICKLASREEFESVLPKASENEALLILIRLVTLPRIVPLFSL